jgi:hypothetical protein
MADAYKRIMIYNDNQAAVDWAARSMNKGTKHINLHENYIRKCHQHGIIKVSHIPSVINTSDLFTKELKDAAHFCQCRDSFMVSKAVFDRHGCIVPSHHQSKDDLPFYSVQSKTTLEASHPLQPRRKMTTRRSLAQASIQHYSHGYCYDNRYHAVTKISYHSWHSHSGQGGDKTRGRGKSQTFHKSDSGLC